MTNLPGRRDFYRFNFYCLVRTTSRGPRPLSALSFIVVPETVPEYLVVILPLSPMSCVTSNITLSPSTFPLLISTGPPRPPSRVPLRDEPACLNVKVWGPPLPPAGASLVHLPEISAAANATRLTSASNAHSVTKRFVIL